MNNRKRSSIGIAVIMTGLLSLAGGLAFARDKAPMKPEIAAKQEMVQKQRKQRVTNEQRKTAAQTLKAERLKIYNARQAAQQTSPATIESK